MDLISATLAMAGIFSPLLSGGCHIFHTLAICANSGPLVVLSPEGGRRRRVKDATAARKEGGGYYQLASPATNISPLTGIIPSDGSCSPT
jgi:hypothetical protein